MDEKKYFIDQLKNIRRNEFLSVFLRAFIIFTFVSLSPFIIQNKIAEKDTLIVIFLILAEVIFISLLYSQILILVSLFYIKNSRIYCCIDKPEAVTEIIISDKKILFEIKGMEDETIYMKPSESRKQLINAIKTIFRNSNLVINK